MNRIRFYFFLLFFAFASNIQAKNFSKEIHSSFTSSEVNKLKISNKFGNIQIHESLSDSVSVYITFSTDDVSERNADVFFKSLNVSQDLQEGVCSFMTNIVELKGPKRDFSVNYRVYIPSTIELDIKSKFGNVSLDNLNAKGTFTIAYGNFTANEIIDQETTFSLFLDCSKANIRKLNKGRVKLNYSALEIDSTNTVQLDSKYSTFTTNVAETISSKGKGGRIVALEVGKLIAEGSYINYDITNLNYLLQVKNSYGHVNIENVSNEFSTVNIDNQYGDILLDVEKEATYNLELKGNYSEVVMRDDQGITKNNSSNSITMYGVTNGTTSSTSVRQVKITSKYGKVAL